MHTQKIYKQDVCSQCVCVFSMGYVPVCVHFSVLIPRTIKHVVMSLVQHHINKNVVWRSFCHPSIINDIVFFCGVRFCLTSPMHCPYKYIERINMCKIKLSCSRQTMSFDFDIISYEILYV